MFPNKLVPKLLGTIYKSKLIWRGRIEFARVFVDDHLMTHCKMNQQIFCLLVSLVVVIFDDLLGLSLVVEHKTERVLREGDVVRVFVVLLCNVLCFFIGVYRGVKGGIGAVFGGKVLEFHNVASQGSRFVREDILDLAELLIEIG